MPVSCLLSFPCLFGQVTPIALKKLIESQIPQI